MSTQHRTTPPDSAMIEPAILAKLRDVTRTSSGWSARCPAHNDDRPSLSVGVGDDGRTLVKCHAGCPAEQIVAAVGMRMADLGPAMNIVAAYDYRDEHGTVLFQAVRLSPKTFRLRRLNTKGDWVWKMDGVRRVPYRLPELRGQRLALLVEGEKDADNVAALGLIAIMSGAIALVHWPNGFDIRHNGFEYNFAIIMMCLCLVLGGPGPFAVDLIFRLRRKQS